MAQQRETPPGYGWEGSPLPSEPEPIALPDRTSDPGPGAHGSPRSAIGAGTRSSAVDDESPDGASHFFWPESDGLGEAPAQRSSRGLPPWSIVAIVALQVVGLVVAVGLVVGGVLRLFDDEPDPAAAPRATQETPASEQKLEPGVVTNSEGVELADGTGTYDDPATVGEHTFSWSTWTDGTIGVTALEVDAEAKLPGAEGTDVLEKGYQLVSVTFEVRYDGPGQLAPIEELWLTGESERSYFQDISAGLVPDPMTSVATLGSGASAVFHSVYIVPESELETFRLGVETFSGEVLYFSIR